MVGVYRKYIAVSLFLICIGLGCGELKKKRNQTLYKTVVGEAYYGGVLKLNETSNFRSLFPLDITEVVGHRIGSQIFEGLFRFNQKTLEVMPSLVKHWKVDTSQTIYTFIIRKGVYFHKDDCFGKSRNRTLKASDVEFCLENICKPSPLNQMFWLFKDKVKGAQEFYNLISQGGNSDFESIKVLNDSTVQIELEKPYPNFLKLLAHSACWIYPREMVEYYKNKISRVAVGTGPFKLKMIAEDEVVILIKNQDYWRTDSLGNTLPYLDGVNIFFIKDKKSELLSFMQDKLDFVYRVPSEMLKKVIHDYQILKSNNFKNLDYYIQIIPALSVYYYGLQNRLPPFDNKFVRQAFAHAIDRKSIVEYVLNGEGEEAKYGFVPPMPNYNFKNIKGLEYNPEKARLLLRKAGYKKLKQFPKITLQTNTGGDRNIQIAEVVQRMLVENLDIEIDIEVIQFAQHLESLETGKALFFRSAWIADYPDPENFLNLLYGGHVPNSISEKSYINSVRYKNYKYDSLYDLAIREIDEKRRNKIYSMADSIAVSEAALIPIFYDRNIRLVKKRVKNFPINGMEYRDYCEVYLTE